MKICSDIASDSIYTHQNFLYPSVVERVFSRDRSHRIEGVGFFQWSSIWIQGRGYGYSPFRSLLLSSCDTLSLYVLWTFEGIFPVEEPGSLCCTVADFIISISITMLDFTSIDASATPAAFACMNFQNSTSMLKKMLFLLV